MTQWDRMSTEQKTHHVVHFGIIGFFRMLLGCAYGIVMTGLGLVAAFKLQPIIEPMWPDDAHPFIAFMVFGFIGCFYFYYVIAKVGVRIAGLWPHDILSGDDWILAMGGETSKSPEMRYRAAHALDRHAREHAARARPNRRRQSASAQDMPSSVYAARARATKETCSYCGTINRPGAAYCGEGQIRGCGARL